ncbi:MAG: hypothetical protein Kilf2KO_09010 [Rhodospirillales bacterium]
MCLCFEGQAVVAFALGLPLSTAVQRRVGLGRTLEVFGFLDPGAGVVFRQQILVLPEFLI